MAKLLLQRLTPQTPKVNADHADDLRVIGAGLPRTGTSSLKAALEILGFGPCHHMAELMDKPDRSIQFARALDGQNVDFHALMKGYGSTVDSPTTEFYKEIHQAYPKAKIILTVRDNGEKWFESMQNAFGSLMEDNSYYFSVYPIRFLRLQWRVAQKLSRKWTAEYGRLGPRTHDQHNARVIEENNDRDLLVFNVKEGWPPLCKFLEVHIPSAISFPNVNDTKTIRRAFTVMRIIGLCTWALLALGVAVVIYFFRYITA